MTKTESDKKETAPSKSFYNDGLDDPDILHNTVETLIYGISNVSIENGGAALRVCDNKSMSELRKFVSQTLKGI